MVHISLIKNLTTHFCILTNIQTIYQKESTTDYKEILQIAEIFDASKVEYEAALKNSGY